MVSHGGMSQARNVLRHTTLAFQGLLRQAARKGGPQNQSPHWAKVWLSSHETVGK